LSGIFGTYSLDDRTIPMESLKQIADLMVHRGPDGLNIWKQDFVGLGHCMLHTTLESLHEHLPYSEAESGLTITADARIDNRRDLGKLLGIQDSILDKISDSQLILSSYSKWGIDCFSKLLGDFSFVIWDRPQKRLLCVRDALGIKPFYYFKNQHTFCFCSEIKPLTKLQPSFPSINEGMVGEYLAFQFSNRHETLFKDIFRLPPAHYLLLENGRIAIKRYWDLSFQTTLYYKNPDEYAEHFLEIFQKSIARRLRSHQPVSSELSGGLDSSSIVAMATSLNRVSNNHDIRPFALIFPELPCDEQHYINSVAKKSALNVNFVPTNHFKPPDWQMQVFQSFHLPDMPNLSISDSLVKEVQASNSRVILSGIGGDEWFTSYDLSLLDLATHRRWDEILREGRFQGKLGYKPLFKRLARILLWPSVPTYLKRRACKKSIKRAFPEWLPDSFISKTNLLDRIAESDSRLHLNSLIDASYYKYIRSDLEGFFIETLDRHRAFLGVENRYPFLDRNFLDFSASLPEYQKTFCGVTKYILRQSLTELLPQEVKNRSDKAEFSYFFGQAILHPAFENNINELTIATIGWIDKEKLLKTYRQTRESLINNPTSPCYRIWPIWFAFAVELWYKSLYDSNTISRQTN
jgi:asparagine synthase (glutamine-hydrolysing)